MADLFPDRASTISELFTVPAVICWKSICSTSCNESQRCLAIHRFGSPEKMAKHWIWTSDFDPNRPSLFLGPFEENLAWNPAPYRGPVKAPLQTLVLQASPTRNLLFVLSQLDVQRPCPGQRWGWGGDIACIACAPKCRRGLARWVWGDGWFHVQSFLIRDDHKRLCAAIAMLFAQLQHLSGVEPQKP